MIGKVPAALVRRLLILSYWLLSRWYTFTQKYSHASLGMLQCISRIMLLISDIQDSS